MVHDSISDFIAIINNAGMVKHRDVLVTHSKIKLCIAEILVKYGYIESVEKIVKDNLPFLRLELKYYKNMPVIESFKRVSKPSNRVYVSSADMKSHRNGLGISLISTSKGLITDKEAKRLGVGGEVICLVF